jgi:hypothetical protein
MVEVGTNPRMGMLGRGAAGGSALTQRVGEPVVVEHPRSTPHEQSSDAPVRGLPRRTSRPHTGGNQGAAVISGCVWEDGKSA